MDGTKDFTAEAHTNLYFSYIVWNARYPLQGAFPRANTSLMEKHLPTIQILMFSVPYTRSRDFIHRSRAPKLRSIQTLFWLIRQRLSV